MALLPIKTTFRGPAPLFNNKEQDIIDEALYFFKANVFFRTYEIKVVHLKVKLCRQTICNFVCASRCVFVAERGWQSFNLHYPIYYWVFEEVTKVRDPTTSHERNVFPRYLQIRYPRWFWLSLEFCICQTEQSRRSWWVPNSYSLEINSFTMNKDRTYISR